MFDLETLMSYAEAAQNGSLWRVSIRGTTEYIMVTAANEDDALSRGAQLLGRRKKDLEADPYKTSESASGQDT